MPIGVYKHHPQQGFQKGEKNPSKKGVWNKGIRGDELKSHFKDTSTLAYWKGKKMSESHKRKISEGLKRAYKEGRKTRIRTPEQRKKISESSKGKRNSPGTEFRPGIYAGDKHWNWKGGITNNKYKRIANAEWRKTRKKVLERDNYECKRCGSNKNLRVHHEIPYRIVPRNDMINLVTLCCKCHTYTERNYIHFDISLGEPMEVLE